MTRMLQLLVLVIAGSATGVLAQERPVEAASGAPRFLLAASPKPVPLDVRRTPVLRRQLALDLKAVTVPEALTTITSQAGLQLTYVDEIISRDTRISLQANAITVAAALTEVLLDAGLDVVFSASNRAVLVRRPPGVVPPQVGAIVGRVTDAKTGYGVAAAEVLLEKTGWRATTDTSGRYRLLDIGVGQYTLTVRRLGYARQSRSVTVQEGRTDTVDIALAPQTMRLNELVTTATGERRRRDVPHDITTINADSLMRTQPIRSVTDLLEGRVPGLSVQRTSGAPGDPARIRLRGASSPNLNNDPIVVVDGVRIYSEQSDARSANLSNPSYAAPSPLDYIDPNSIETVEIVKGASATTLYGQDAANGVIVITTKKGKAGPTRWSMALEHGITDMVGKYPERMLRWGHTPDYGLLIACPVGDFFSPTGPCVGDSIVRFQLLNEPDLTPFGTGRRTEGSLTVSGGAGTLGYSLTGSYSHELGLLRLPDYEIARYETRVGRTPPDWMRRPQAFTQWGITSALSAKLGKANLAFNAAVSQNDQQRSALENQLGDLDATYLDRASGRYFDLTGLDIVGTGVNYAGGVRFADHALDDYYTSATAGATSLTTGVQLNWQPHPWVTTTADAGINVVQRGDVTFLARGASPSATDSLGLLADGQGRSLRQTLNLRAVVTRPLGGFTLRLSTGATYTGTTLRDVAVATRSLPPGQKVPGDILVARPRRLDSDLATFGWYFEPALDHGRFTLISGLQLAGGNSFGSGLKLPTFPKLGGSWLLSDEPFFPFKNLFTSFRIRAAYGRAGRQPGPADKLRLYDVAHLAPIDQQSVLITTLQRLGNTKLRPERSGELEGGLDADFFDSRVSLSATMYRKTTDDAIIDVGLPLSLGGGTTLLNFGVTRNTGLDVDLTAQLVRSAPVRWSTHLILSRQRGEVIRLGPDVQPFSVGGGGLGPEQRVVPGYPLFGFWVKPVVGYTDLNQDKLIEGNEIVLGDSSVYRGSPLPDYIATLSSALSLWGTLHLTADLRREQGVTQHPSTERIQRQIGLSAGRNDPAASSIEQVMVASYGLTQYYWLQQVSTTRLSAVSVSYTVPGRLARRVGAEEVSLSLQGSNLRLWSNYRGVDPNVNAYSTGNLMADGGQLPQPRTWQMRVNVRY